MTRPRAVVKPLIRPEALPAWDTFGRVLSALAEQGRSTPCTTDPRPFVSDLAHERRAAARACHGCPALAECEEYAAAQPEGWWVWAGIDRTPTPRGTRP